MTLTVPRLRGLALAGATTALLMASGAAVASSAPAPVAPDPAPVTTTGAASVSYDGYALHHNPDGTVIRWNPCEPIPYQVNPRNGGPTAEADAAAAVDIVRRESGLNLVYTGTTDVVPQRGHGFDGTPANPRTPLVIAWAAPGTGPGTSSLLNGMGGAAGVGGVTTWSYTPPGAAQATPWQVVSGFVVLDSRTYPQLAPGFGPAASSTRGRLVLHELGHAIGLDHTNTPGQVMNPTVSGAATPGFAAGDRKGLERVGRAAGGLDGAPCAGEPAPPVVAPAPSNPWLDFWSWLVALFLSFFR
ncbi:matrixin family metalloprotease [Rhodococcus sp. X156]|uniref:matrixin family metalloprotease n=1 Tax=Rhodococcus sp. X156 TaxID=2499145 RepID=UPI000FD9728F|nr:matrixin family metalloprotease [Rhodococcus sp. X156]